jgi:catechol 2,3-dioxygenase-like lactoylglutathione lyase family enzyme
MTSEANKQFELRGVNHLALVCKDMARTVDFYSNVLGMPLIKTIDLPMGMGQHFFFDMGGSDSLAFFWFPDAPEAAPGVAAPAKLPGQGSLASAHGSMNHVAFDIDADKIEEYREKLIASGIEVSEISNHDDSPMQSSPEVSETTFVRSIYFFDPDGTLLEFAGWTREMTAEDVSHEPATEQDVDRYRESQKREVAAMIAAIKEAEKAKE